jgi:ATP-grasp domain, R2K clade family 3
MPIFFRPYRDLRTAPASRGPADLALVARLEAALGVAIARDPAVDFEDWMEPACVLDALLAAGVAVTVLERGSRLTQPEVAFDIPGRAVEPTVVLGRLSQHDDVDLPVVGAAWPVPGQESLANRYGELNAFLANSGRRCVLADMPGEPELPDEAACPAAALTTFAGKPIVLKQTRPAKAFPLTPADVPDEVTAEVANRFFFEIFEWHFARFEGLPKALLLQDQVTMAFETRLFVVGGEVVAGAGCVENHTPLDANDPQVSDLLEAKRNRSPAMPHPLTRDTLVAFGRTVAAQAAAEGLTDFVLDVALGPNGPLVVEFNPGHNAGLYATPVQPLVAAILRRVGA